VRYVRHVLIALDQLFNALVGGWPDETLSAYAWRKQDWRYKAINALFFWQMNHCRAAYEAERLRHHLPPEERPET
jgi:predicted alpha-1,6-mannanase (GH76 family)